MKKYLTTTIAAAVALVLIIVGVIVVLAVNNKQQTPSEDVDDGTDTSYVKLIEFNYNNVAKIESFTNDTLITVECVKETDEKGNVKKTWVCTSDPDTNANTGNVNSLVSSILTSCSGTIIEDRDVLSEYGFDENGKSNLYFRITDDRGSVRTVYVGYLDFSKNYRYVCIDDGSLNVYRLNIYSADRMLFQKSTIILVKPFAFLTTDIPSKLTIIESGEKVMNLDCVGVDAQSTQDQNRVVGLWTMNYPIERKTQDSIINSLMKDLNSVAVNDIVANNVTEDQFVEYGLAPATIEYHLEMINGDSAIDKYVLKIGNKDADGKNFYCLVDNGTDGKYVVYTISTGAVYRSINPLDYMDSYLYLEDSDLLSSVEIEIKGEEKHVMTYTYETPEGATQEVVTRFFDGKEAVDDDTYAVVASDNRYTPVTEEDLKFNRDDDITNDIVTINPYEGFNRVLLSLYVNFKIQKLELEEPSPEQLGEKIATVTYTERNGNVYKIEVYEKEDNYAWSYINGKYAGGCIKTIGLSRGEYALYDYMAAVKCLKIVMAMIP